MVYNTENGASLQKLSDKSYTSGKRQWILLLEIEEKEGKTPKTFQKLLEQISQSLQYNLNSQSQRSRGNTYEETDQELDISGNTGTIPK